MPKPKSDRGLVVTLRISEKEMMMIRGIQQALETENVSATLRKLVVKASKGFEAGWLGELMR